MTCIFITLFKIKEQVSKHGKRKPERPALTFTDILKQDTGLDTWNIKTAIKDRQGHHGNNTEDKVSKQNCILTTLYTHISVFPNAKKKVVLPSQAQNREARPSGFFFFFFFPHFTKSTILVNMC